MINTINASLHGPKAHSFQNELKSLAIWHIIDHILTGDATKQTTLRTLAQLLKRLLISQVWLLNHFKYLLGLFDACVENIELNVAEIYFYDRNFRLRYGKQIMEVILTLYMLHKTDLKFSLTDIFLAKDQDDVDIGARTMHVEHV